MTATSSPVAFAARDSRHPRSARRLPPARAKITRQAHRPANLEGPWAPAFFKAPGEKSSEPRGRLPRLCRNRSLGLRDVPPPGGDSDPRCPRGLPRLAAIATLRRPGEGYRLPPRLAANAIYSCACREPHPCRKRLSRRECGRYVSSVWVLLWSILGATRSSFKTRHELALENLALRQQIGVLTRTLGERRPRLGRWDRALWVLLSRGWAGWREALAIIQPATVIRWHRDGLRRFWTRRSRAQRAGRPGLNREIVNLILRMSQANLTWGAPRIRNELGRADRCSRDGQGSQQGRPSMSGETPRCHAG